MSSPTRTTALSDPPAALLRHRAEAERLLRERLAGDLPLHSLLRYHMGWESPDGSPSSGAEGKALRPALCLLACAAVGGSTVAALPAAAAVELVHSFSLIHDDIQDGDRERRHRPTVWALWGQAQALVAGDALHTVADATLSSSPRAPQTERPRAARLVEASSLLTRRSLEMIEGQYLDLSFEHRFDVMTADYLDMVSRKTGALIAASLELGALLGGASAETVAAFGRCGRLLGSAFQVRDDVLGIWGDETATGKPTGSDIRRRKKTYPVVYALHNASPAGVDALRHVYQSAQPDVERALRVLEEAGARQAADALSQAMGQQAQDALASVEMPPSLACDFQELIGFVVHRER